MLSRRNFLRNTAGLLIAAPMVVKASSLMPIFVPKPRDTILRGELGRIEDVRIITSNYESFDWRMFAARYNSGLSRMHMLNQEPPNLQFMSIGGYSDDRVFQELMGKDAMHSRLGLRAVS